ncbi:O-antigen/teichoic acid export membrane protein [Actinoplanes campanulatus]|uniref:O-antigen/teichoic acid export membrane protein n=1 Tax=Actinoplanes campanulatus TaxID=113559 RepID=A0A7W5AGL5_9ACTN|nr:hypothetical protein [Actinoplanes campanulatus]MBB3095675.1 O-antigen/teichoic acid export membrane protein [Actinoplanes campanulatus]GGN10683.1 hypothetical protein GCM10010109_20520 [Actinoplanes campanulatus]GID36568.1 hypothetical protein Aca09nite_30740 [Actinoplanes campanulatus]
MSLRSLLRAVPATVRRDFVATLFVQFLVLGIGLYLFHLVAERGSVDGFAFYQIARSVVSTVQPAVLLGLGVSLYRFLPRTVHTTRRLALQAMSIEAGLVTAVALAGAVAGDEIAALLGLPGGRSATTAVLITLAGSSLCAVALAALRGAGQVAASNLALGIGGGVVPLAAFAATDRIEDFLLLQGLATAVVGIGATFAVRRRRPPAPSTSPAPEPDVKTLIAYGVRRMPGELALPALFTVPTLAVAVTTTGGEDAGYVGFTTSAVTLICSVFAMLTPVLMPRLSRLFHHGGVHRAVRRRLAVLPLLAAVVATLPTGVIILFAPPMVHGFLGPEFDAAVPVLRLGVLAAVPLAMFYTARPVLDVLFEAKPMSRLLVACLTVEVVMTAVGTRFLTPSYASMLGLLSAATVLGLTGVGLAATALRRSPS